MKTILFSLTLLIAPLASAQLPSQNNVKAQEAEYFVPAPPELEEYSNFKIKINEAYAGGSSQTLSYTFPPELTGVPELTVTLKRVPGTVNNWESKEMNAVCEEDSDIFTCEIFLNKKPITANKKMVDLGSVFSGNMVLQSSQASEFETFINKKNVVDFLTTNAVSPQALKSQKDILDIFLSSEPAGILSYKFTPYAK